MKLKKSLKNASPEAHKPLIKENCFHLSLHTQVTGTDSEGNSFEEKTRLSSISSQKAIFPLKSRVKIGSKLGLSLDIPKTLILQGRLNLLVSGKVICSQTERGRKKDRITIQLERAFKIHPFVN